MADDIHEIYALRYAHHDRQSPENYLFGDPHDILQPLAYYVWAIKGPHGTIVVDTGFDLAMAQKRGRQIVKPVRESLSAVGIAADAVEHIIVTHLHYDHCGNHDLFPAARYHLQDDEMAYATGRCMCHPLIRIPFEADDVTAMVRKVFADRVTFHDGAWEMVPGVTVHKIGGHSKGLQCVRVRTRRGWVVLAADASHLYSHINDGRVFPVTYNVGDVLEGYETIKRLAGSIDHIIPGHDPEVVQRYPAAHEALEGFAVRLDVPPSRRESP
jgi:glyoxylase-like metal-dependent hydrolase (beta-lactamase superfamily II)